MLILMTSMSKISASTNQININNTDYNWPIPVGTEFVYNITNVQYNSTNYLPMDENNNTMGFREGNLFVVQIDEYPTDNNIVHLTISGTELWYTNYEYDYHFQYSWNNSIEGPFLLMPIIPVPSDPANWTNFENNWNAVNGISATHTSNPSIFTLSGSNSTANITNFTVKWDENNGLMNYYYFSGGNGPNDLPFIIELSLLYTRSIDQWDIHWGVDNGIMIAYSWDMIDRNGSSMMYFDDMNESGYVSQGDLTVAEINNLSLDFDPPAFDIHWVGQNLDFYSSSYYEDIEHLTDEGPNLFYPILPIGNDAFNSNITDIFRGFPGSTVTWDNNLFTVKFGIDGHFENATWDMTTGILQHFGYIDPYTTIKINIVYDFNPRNVHYSYDNYSQRYIVDVAKNGTNDFLDFGPVEGSDWDYIPYEDRPHFIINTGELLELMMWRNYGSENTEYEYGIKTQSGLFTDLDIKQQPPGLETLEDGPPAFYPIIPISSDDPNWWDVVANIYSSLPGYTVINNETQFGITIQPDNFTLASVVWDKFDGVLNSYHVIINDGQNYIELQIHRGIIISPTSIGWHWAINTPLELNYETSNISWDGFNSIPFGDNNETSIADGDIINVVINELGDLENMESEHSGPWQAFTMTVHSVSQEWDIWLEEPGFEQSPNNDKPILLVFVIPVGDENYWNLMADLYGEANYDVVNDADTFSVHINLKDNDFAEIKWNKTTGVMMEYSFSVHMNGNLRGYTMLLTNPVIDTTELQNSTEISSNSSTEASPQLPIPGFTFTSLSIIIAVILIRKKKKY